MHERAQDFILNQELKTEGMGDMCQNEDDVAVFAILHPTSASRTVGVVNKTNDYLKVTVDMTSSSGVLFTPTSGKVTKVVNPRTLRYFCSVILDPTCDGGRIGVKHTYEIFKPSQGEAFVEN